MLCVKPLEGYRSEQPNENGKFPVLFNQPKGKDYAEISLPCGQCIGCRLNYAQSWALRCTHEMSFHEENCFITLTYDDDHLPDKNSLNKKDFQLFIKKLRKSLAPKKIRYYMCGEYGQDQTLLKLGIDAIGRPHFHAIIFGHQFPDLEVVPETVKSKDPILTSEILSKLWGKGFVTVGDANTQTAAYVARYVTKKITGDQAYDQYQILDEHTGEIHLKQPEYGSMSLKPAIGQQWYEKYKNDLKKGFVTLNGVKNSIPKLYLSKLEGDDPLAVDNIKETRILRGRANNEHQTYDRLNVAEAIMQKRSKRLKRNL